MVSNYYVERLFAMSKGSKSFGQIFGQMIPDPCIDRITIHGGLTNTAPLKVKLFFTLKDIIDPSDELISSWYRSLGNDDPESSSFEEFVKIEVVQCTHPLVFDYMVGKKGAWKALSDSEVGFLDHQQTRTINLKEKIPLDFDPDTEALGLDEFKQFDEQGRATLYIPIEETFKVHPKPADINGVEHLSYFVWATLDLAAMAKALDIQERFLSKIKLKRYVAVEKVIENYNLVLDTMVYLMPDGTQWTGPVHHHSPNKNPLPSDPKFDGYMTGAQHTEGSVKLTSSIQPNQKIRDMRATTRVDERYRSVTQQRIGAGLVEGAALVGQAVDEEIITKSANEHIKYLGQREIRPEKPSAFFTSLYTSVDEMHNASGLFGFDWIAFLKNNCAFPWLWEVSGVTTSRLLQLASVRRLNIYRRQVNANSRNLNRVGTPYLPRPTKKYWSGVTLLGSATERPSHSWRWSASMGDIEDVITSNKVKKIDDSRLFLKELKIYSNDQPEGLRWFTFTDRNVIQEKNGTYQYSVIIESRDPTVALLTSQYRKLLRARRHFAQYSYYAAGYTNQKPNYDIYLVRFIPEFIETFSTNADNRSHYWQSPLDDYLNVLNTISNTLQEPAYPGASYTLETTLPATLTSYADPRKGSVEGITVALGMFDTLLGAIKKHLSSTVPRDLRGSTANGVRKSHIRHKGAQRTLRIMQTFDNEITLDGMRGKGYDYLTNQTLDFASESIKGAGLRLLSARYFRARSDVETKRFFSTPSAKWSYTTLLKSAVPDIDLDSRGGDDNLKTSKFTFFTPSFVFASPGTATGNATFSQTSYGPPPTGAGAGGSAKSGISLQKFGFGANSYKASKKAFGILSNNMMAPVSLLPLGLQMQMAATMAPVTKTLDDVTADLLVSQGNPDFNLYPANIKAYEVPGQKGSKLSEEEQQAKAKYAAVLAGKGCVVVSAKKEFGGAKLLTKSHPEGFDIEHIKYKPKTFDIFNFAATLGKLKKSLYINHINPLMFNSNTYSVKTDFFPVGLRNLKSLSILKAAGNATSGIKPAMKGLQTPVGFGSVHVGNLKLLNFTGSGDKTILDSTNPSKKASMLKALPNQLKSLVLSGNSQFPLNDVFSVEPTATGAPIDPAAAAAMTATNIAPLFQIKNLNMVFQLYKNIIQIEYLNVFTMPSLRVRDPQTGQMQVSTGSRPLLRDPQWVLLNEGIINDLEDKVTERTTILCRIVRYVNRDLGIGHQTKLDLPIIDKHFILTIDPDAEDPVAWSFDWGNWIFPSLFTGGSTAQTTVDSRDLKKKSANWKIKSPHDGNEITVKEFEGTVLAPCPSNSQSGDGGLP